MHSAWAVTLGGILHREDVVFGSTVSGREADVPGIEDVVGLLINTIPVRVRWDGTTTARELLASVRRHQSAVLAHQHVSLTRIGRQAGSAPCSTPWWCSTSPPRWTACAGRATSS
ncbi:condensation domain-containing protein [Nonomuraea antimicrobica]